MGCVGGNPVNPTTDFRTSIASCPSLILESSAFADFVGRARESALSKIESYAQEIEALKMPWWEAGYDNVGKLQAMIAERRKTIQADISQGAQLLESIAALLSQCNAITDECVSNERAGGQRRK